MSLVGMGQESIQTNVEDGETGCFGIPRLSGLEYSGTEIRGVSFLDVESGEAEELLLFNGPLETKAKCRRVTSS